MKEQLTDELTRLIGFTDWVKKNYGYSVGGGLWKHSLQYDLILTILQKWLREEKGIIVLPEDECHPEIWVFNIKNEDINNHYAMEAFKTYELALERGLYKALKLIKK